MHTKRINDIEEIAGFKQFLIACFIRANWKDSFSQYGKLSHFVLQLLTTVGSVSQPHT